MSLIRHVLNHEFRADVAICTFCHVKRLYLVRNTRITTNITCECSNTNN